MRARRSDLPVFVPINMESGASVNGHWCHASNAARGEGGTTQWSRFHKAGVQLLILPVVYLKTQSKNDQLKFSRYPQVLVF